MSKNGGGIIGVSDHGGWVVLVTVARDGTLLPKVTRVAGYRYLFIDYRRSNLSVYNVVTSAQCWD